MKDIKIIVATHKKYRMPKDNMYLPIQVGAKGKVNIGYQIDSTGDNISEKNSSFSELTGLYWAWKNLNTDYIGLTHYRRHFRGNARGKDRKEPFNLILTKKEAEKLLENTDILVTKKRRYYIVNIYNHYANTLYIETLDKAKKIIWKKYPEYADAFDKCMKRTYMHAFNMFIMKREILNEYCTWLFDILFDLEEELKDKDYNEFHARYPGRVGEILLDVWLEKNRYTYQEIPFIYTENINIFKKILMFLKANFLKEKYETSI